MTVLTRTDYYIAISVGFLTGVFAIPTLVTLGIRAYFILIPLPALAAIAFFLGLRLGGFLSRWLSFLAQFSKFVLVGFLNTAVDFGILNILSGITGVTAGFIVGGVNVPGFSVAVLNSYLWNKFWVFKGKEETVKDLPKFLAVSVAGLLINSGIIVLLTTFVPASVSGELWLNVSKVVATAAVLSGNFLGYKFLVFGRKRGPLE